MGRLFGTDGVRGVAGVELTSDLAFGLGRAAVVVLGRHGAGDPTFVVDCANGAASSVAPDVLRRLGATVHPIFDDPEGEINAGCGALHPEVVAAEVVRLGADAGVAHDGDADRALFADAGGAVIDGDQVLAACAVALAKEGRLAKNTVVTTVMANIGFMRAMADAGIEVIAARA